MVKRVAVLCIALGSCLAPRGQAANIIWVSDDKNGSSTPSDIGFTNLLRDQGYSVDYQGEGGTGTPGYQHWRTLDDTKIAALNAADLVIVSRDLDSGSYASNATEVAQWNAIGKPILLLIAHIARNNRWQWLDTGGQNDVQPVLQAVKLDHPVFRGVALDANNQVSFLSAISSISSATSAGNGTLIATRADGGQVWIAEWEPGQVFHSATTQVAGGKRMLFAAGATAGGGPDGTFNLTADGQKMFLNAVRYLLGEAADRGAAKAPTPEDAATDIARDATLGWNPGRFAAAHDVYLGLSAADVNNAGRIDSRGTLVSRGQTENGYSAANFLEFGQTYYWRVDEVNAPPDSTIVKGDVWSFTVEPFAYPIGNITATASSSQMDMGPEKAIDGSGLDAEDRHSTEAKEMWMSAGIQPAWIQFEFDRTYKLHELWVWNTNQFIESMVGFGARDVTVEYSTDGNVWIPLAGVPEFSRASGQPGYAHNTTVSFGGLLARYVKLTIDSTWGNMPQTGLSEVRFLHIPVQARGPEPADGAVDVGVDAALAWRPGREAASHTVYLGIDRNAVVNGTAPAVVASEHNHTPASLEFGMTYYWRVDEVNEAAVPGTWQGEIWSFTTAEYAVVDDFESYTDDEGSRIYETWVDGWTNNTGSVVGYLQAPFAERAIVHGGRQSMPLEYDNGSAPFYSEVEREFSPAQDWTGNGADTLVLHFQGRGVFLPDGSAGNGPASLYVAIEDSAGKIKVVSHPDTKATTLASWEPWPIPLSEFSGVNLARVQKMYIGVGDRANPKQGGAGLLFIDDIGFGRPATAK